MLSWLSQWPPVTDLRSLVVGQNCRGKPRTVWNNVLLSDSHKLSRYTRDALNKPVWRELTCVACT